MSNKHMKLHLHSNGKMQTKIPMRYIIPTGLARLLKSGNTNCGLPRCVLGKMGPMAGNGRNHFGEQCIPTE